VVHPAPRPEASFKDTFDTVADQIERVLRGKRRAVHLSLVCLFAEGHLLIEDVPGVAPEPDDLVAYLRWCREYEHLGRARRKG